MSVPRKDPSEPEPANVRIGRAVWGAMKMRGVKAVELAALLHLGKSSMSARLSGKTPFSAHELVVIAERLEVDPGQFFADSPSFPLRREWTVIDGEGPELPPLGQGRLPLRSLELVH